MSQRIAFDEPASPRVGPLAATEPRVNWFLQSTRPNAAEGRPDRDEAIYRSLRGSDHARFLTALDELLVHDHLQRSYRVEYEEGEGSRPDFRLYDRGNGYVGAVEVASLFLRQDWAAEQRRSGWIEVELNRRLPLSTHSLGFEIRRWDGQPTMRHLVPWLGQTIEDLRANPDALGLGI